MTITTERYFAICHPFCYGSHRLSHSSRVHLLTYILPSILISVVLNIPKFLETELVRVNYTDANNVTVTVTDYDVTHLRLDPEYILFYTHWTRLLGTGIIPFAYLAIINTVICLEIQKAKLFSSQIQNIRRSSDSYRQHFNTHAQEFNPSERSKKQKGNNTVLTLSIIVMMYLISNTPRLCLNLAEYVLSDTLYVFDSCNCSLAPSWFFILINISHLLLAINSSANFLIYFSVCKRFRPVFAANIRRKFFKRPQEQILSSDNELCFLKTELGPEATITSYNML